MDIAIFFVFPPLTKQAGTTMQRYSTERENNNQEKGKKTEERPERWACLLR